MILFVEYQGRASEKDTVVSEDIFVQMNSTRIAGKGIHADNAPEVIPFKARAENIPESGKWYHLKIKTSLDAI